MDTPAMKRGAYWGEVIGQVEPNWSRTREDAGGAPMCARCLLMMMLPASSADVHTREGVFPVATSGEPRVREVRRAAGDGHLVLLNGASYGVFADTEFRGEALCAQHLLHAVADLGNSRAPSL